MGDDAARLKWYYLAGTACAVGLTAVVTDYYVRRQLRALLEELKESSRKHKSPRHKHSHANGNGIDTNGDATDKHTCKLKTKAKRALSLSLPEQEVELLETKEGGREIVRHHRRSSLDRLKRFQEEQQEVSSLQQCLYNVAFRFPFAVDLFTLT